MSLACPALVAVKGFAGSDAPLSPRVESPPSSAPSPSSGTGATAAAAAAAAAAASIAASASARKAVLIEERVQDHVLRRNGASSLLTDACHLFTPHIYIYTLLGLSSMGWPRDSPNTGYWLFRCPFSRPCLPFSASRCGRVAPEQEPLLLHQQAGGGHVVHHRRAAVGVSQPQRTQAVHHQRSPGCGAQAAVPTLAGAGGVCRPCVPLWPLRPTRASEVRPIKPITCVAALFRGAGAIKPPLLPPSPCRLQRRACASPP